MIAALVARQVWLSGDVVLADCEPADVEQTKSPTQLGLTLGDASGWRSLSNLGDHSSCKTIDLIFVQSVVHVRIFKA